MLLIGSGDSGGGIGFRASSGGLALDDVGREGPQIELRRLTLDGDGERDGQQLELKGDVGLGREGQELELRRLIGLEGQTLRHGRLDRRGI